MNPDPAVEHRIRSDLTVILSSADALDGGAGEAGPVAEIRAAVRRIATALDGDAPPRAPASGAAIPKGARVLSIDDDADNLALLEVILTTADLEVDTATSAPEALAKAHGAAFDAVVVDWHLGDGLAADLIGTLRGSSGSPAVVVLTGDPAARAMAFAAGAQEVVLKPVDIDELLDRLATALAVRDLRSAHR